MKSRWHRRTAAGMLALMMVTTSQLRAEGIYIAGVVDCGSWIKARTTNVSEIFEGYLVGMMNGLALGSGVEFWFASGAQLKEEQVYLWMDKYCRENPLSSLVPGTVKLMNENTENGYSAAKGFRPQQ